MNEMLIQIVLIIKVRFLFEICGNWHIITIQYSWQVFFRDWIDGNEWLSWVVASSLSAVGNDSANRLNCWHKNCIYLLECSQLISIGSRLVQLPLNLQFKSIQYMQKSNSNWSAASKVASTSSATEASAKLSVFLTISAKSITFRGKSYTLSYCDTF